MAVHWLKFSTFLLFITVCKSKSTPSTQESLEDHLAITTCANHVQRPLATFRTNGDMICATATDDKRSEYTYFDDRRVDATKDVSFYTAFQGVMSFKDNTPKFCFPAMDHYPDTYLSSFEINFRSEDPKTLSRVEVTPCRTGGYWTNGKVFCSPPECEAFLSQQKDTQSFYQIFGISINMNDLNNLPDGTTIMKFASPSDHRRIYNIVTNETRYLSTKEFLDLCQSEGPCYKGKFLGNDNILYQFGGHPLLQMKIKSGKLVIGMRYDPREFLYPEKDLLTRCRFRDGESSGKCDSPSGFHTWKILWESSLPFYKEWLTLHINISWSYKQNCKIKISDVEYGISLVEFEGPCGRQTEMKLGNYPYPKFGVYGRDKKGNGEYKMKFRNIILINSQHQRFESHE